MKKTLMVLSFALCTTLAFAQTNNVRNGNMQLRNNQTAAVSEKGEQTVSYKGSIFTKTDPIAVHDFSVADADGGYTIGTVSAGQMIDGQAVTATDAHSQVAASSKWRRIADTTHATCVASQANFPVLFGSNSFSSLNGFNSTTPMNGLMVMSMEDQIAAWGGTGDAGSFNAYIAFAPISTSGVAIVDVELYQYYRKFNADKCFIDYSTDGTTWHSTEFNIRNVDVNVNNSIRGKKTVTLPTACANQNEVTIRLRWACNSNNGGAYGYYWMVDDVTFIGGAADRLNVVNVEYVEGAYAIMPQGLNLPLSWYVAFANNGTNTRTNVKGGIYAADGSVIAASTPKTVAANPAVLDSAIIDGNGWINGEGIGFISNGVAQGTVGAFATDNAGLFLTNSMLTSDAVNDTFATIQYQVLNPEENDGHHVWAMDNGILTRHKECVVGIEASGEYISTDPEEVPWTEAGYRLYNHYVTGPQVPEGWVLRGMEVVASTYDGYARAGAKIAPHVFVDSLEGNSFLNLPTGAGVHTVTAAELNTGADSIIDYAMYGDYNVIRMLFPEQPELQPNTSYRIGYRLAEDGYFMVATDASAYWDAMGGDTSVRYADVPELANYSRRFGHQYYDILGTDNNTQYVHFYGTTITSAPMIRLLVGPRMDIAQHEVTFRCADGVKFVSSLDQDEDGNIIYAAEDDLCGQTIEAAEGSAHGWYIYLPDGVELRQIVANGQAIDIDENFEEGEMNLTTGEVVSVEIVDDGEVRYGYVSIEGFHGNIELGMTTHVGINQVAANVSMKLQPNPATSSVKLNINGVNGMVDYALIDMSGRVIRNGKMNAENAQVIDLSNVAKGAYFVRITNDTFSKVEKLIVR